LETSNCKRTRDVDAVIIALKKTDLYQQGMIASVKVALMQRDGKLVELADVAGFKDDVKKALWKLHKFKVREDQNYVYVKPKVVVQVTYSELFPSTKKTFDENLNIVDEIQFFSLRHPRFSRVRLDKKVNVRDLRIGQLGG